MANKDLNIGIKVDSTQLNQATQKLGELKQLSKGLSIQYDINGKPLDLVIDKSLNLQKQARLLTAELRRTKEGTAEFQLLSTRLGDVQDQLAATNAKSKDLFASLSLLPGPVGQFFGQLNGAIGLLKTFSSFSFKDLQFQLKETLNDIKDIGKGFLGIGESKPAIDGVNNSLQQTASNAGAVSASYSRFNQQNIDLKTGLDRLENSFENVNTSIKNGVPFIEANGKAKRQLTKDEIALVTSGKALTVTTEGLVVAEKAATFWTSTLGKTIQGVLIGTGVGIAIVAIGELINLIIRLAGSEEEATQATNALTAAFEEQQRVLQNDMDAIEMATKLNITRAKIAGKTEQEITKITLQGGQERLDALRKYDEELFKDRDLIAKNTKLKEEDRAKLLKDINDKILKNGQDITKQILTNEQTRLDAQLSIAEKGREKNKKVLEDRNNDEKTAAQMLLELRKENTLATIQDERLRQYKELELQAATDIDKVNALKISEEKKGELRNQIFLKYAKKQIELNKKFNDEDIKKAEETAKKKEDILEKINQYSIDAIANQTLKEKAERQKKFDDELKDLDKALKDKLISQQQYDDAVKMMRTALENDLKKIDADGRQREKDAQLKKLDEDIRFLQIMNEANIRTFTAYWKGREELLKKAKERELLEVGDSEEKKHAIEKKYAQLSKNLQMEKFQAVLGYISSSLSVLSGFFQQQQTINNLAMDNELAKVKDNAAEQDKIKEKYFYKNRNAQKGQATIQTFQSAIQAFSALAGIPVVGPALGAAAAAAAILFGMKQVKLIGQQTYQSSTSGGADGGAGGPKPELPNYLRNYEDGGMIGGRRHAEGGTIIEAERGEAIMTRGAVTMFKPLLSLMNQAGGGVSFNSNLTTTSYDNPKVSTPSEENKPMIIKSYVVSNELTNEQQRQARLKDLSTL